MVDFGRLGVALVTALRPNADSDCCARLKMGTYIRVCDSSCRWGSLSVWKQLQ